MTKVVILAGGKGTRIAEETGDRPKPMIEIGGKPILWHLMKIYSSHGLKEFIICCGYKGYQIKEYFANYFMHHSDITFDMNNNKMIVHQRFVEPWTVTLVDTGEDTMTGGRLRRIKKYVEKEKSFCFTYGDGLGDVNITDLIKFHNKSKRIATLTAVQPPGRFGVLKIKNTEVFDFKEKPVDKKAYVNGGFFVLSPGCIDLIKDDDTVWEHDPLNLLSKDNNLGAFVHNGFWQPMDTLRDKNYLNELWAQNKAPWKNW